MNSGPSARASRSGILDLNDFFARKLIPHASYINGPRVNEYKYEENSCRFAPLYMIYEFNSIIPWHTARWKISGRMMLDIPYIYHSSTTQVTLFIFSRTQCLIIVAVFHLI